MNRLELIKQGIENLSEEDFNKRFGDLIKKEKYFIPKKGEFYCYLLANGDTNKLINNKQMFDESIFKNNKVFRTREEALEYRDKQQFLLQMERDFLDNSDEIDWKDEYQNKYYITYDNQKNVIDFSSNAILQSSRLYTTNYVWLKRYVKDNKENIKKYYFDIKESK